MCQNLIPCFLTFCSLLTFKILNYSSCNTIGQSCFITFATRTACPFLKLKRCILLVMYNWLNGFYCVMSSKYSITLLFFGSNSRRASLLRPRSSIVSIASCCTKKLKSSRTCLIGYTGFISHEWLLIAWGAHTHTHKHKHTHTHTHTHTYQLTGQKQFQETRFKNSYHNKSEICR